MRSRTYTFGYCFKQRLGLILLLVCCLFRPETTAQVKIAPAKVNLNDSLNFDPVTQGILNKIVKSVKFTSNRNNKESQRIYEFMQKLIKEKKLKIDSATVTQIVAQLNQITVLNDSTRKIIEQVIETNQLNFKASKSVVDSIKTQMNAVIQENADNNNQQKRELSNKVNSTLKDIRKVQSSLVAGFSPVDSLIKGDTLYYFQTKLSQKINIVGWYYSWMKEEFRNLNYNFLTVVNLSGYELSPDGRSKNPDELKNFQRKGGVIDSAHYHNCPVHLSVFSSKPAEIAKFLNDKQAQQSLTDKLIDLVTESRLKGINIYFDYIQQADSKKFVQFIAALSQTFKSRDAGFQLSISLPALKDEASIPMVNAYDFQQLNVLVDHYQIMTDNFIRQRMDLAQSASPLFSSSKYGNRSIESTIAFYSSGKIPVSKLFMSVSYKGIIWEVNNFSGTLKSNAGSFKTYGFIVENYINSKMPNSTVIEGFDPDQVSAYLNFVGDRPNYKEQIWFDDFRSLYLKYTWALENELGGVVVKGLGYDDGYSELWNSIGAALIRIDTLIVNQKPLKPAEIEKTNCIKTFFDGFSWKIFWSDLQWAVAEDLWYYNSAVDTCDCVYDKAVTDQFILQGNYWANQEYRKNLVLNNSDVCNSLFTRWRIYTAFFQWSGLVCLVVLGLVIFISMYYKRYNLGYFFGSHILIKLLLTILILVSLFGFVFFAPYLELFTITQDGSKEGKIILVCLLIGGIIGWLLASGFYKNNRVPKNQP